MFVLYRKSKKAGNQKIKAGTVKVVGSKLRVAMVIKSITNRVDKGFKQQQKHGIGAANGGGCWFQRV